MKPSLLIGYFTQVDISLKIEKDVKKSSGRGAFFQIAGGGFQTVIRLGASTILARILIPSDFGLFGMALLLSELVLRIGALGMGIGIIVKRNITEDDLSTAFWTMAAIRMIIFFFTFIFAPLLATFFNEPQIVSVIRAISFTFLFQIFGVIGNALLKKRLQFFQIFIIAISSSVLESGLAIALVFLYKQNYWALVVAMVTASLWNNILVFILTKWRPRLRFDRESFRFLFRYGINSLGASLTEYLGSNADYFIIGKILGPKILGLYEFAYRIPFLIENRISIPLREIMFPTLAMLNTSDDKLTDGYIKGVKFIALICFPALGGLAAVADLAVNVLWGEQWLPIVVPLQILCFASAIKCTANPVRVVFLCKDRPDIPFKFSLILLVFTIITVSTLGYFFGMIGVSWAMLITTFPNLVLIAFAFRLLKVSPYNLIRAVWPVLISTLVCIASAYSVQFLLNMIDTTRLIVLIISISAGALSYFVSLRIGFVKTYREIIETLIIISGVKNSKIFRVFG